MHRLAYAALLVNLTRSSEGSSLDIANRSRFSLHTEATNKPEEVDVDDDETIEFKRKLLIQAKKERVGGNLSATLRCYHAIIDYLAPNDMHVLQSIGEIQLALGWLQEASDTYLALARYYAKEGYDLKAIALYAKYFKIPINTVSSLWTVGPKLELAALYGQRGLRVSQSLILLELAEFLQQQAEKYVTEARSVVAHVHDSMTIADTLPCVSS